MQSPYASPPLAVAFMHHYKPYCTHEVEILFKSQPGRGPIVQGREPVREAHLTAATVEAAVSEFTSGKEKRSMNMNLV